MTENFDVDQMLARNLAMWENTSSKVIWAKDSNDIFPDEQMEWENRYGTPWWQ